MKKIGQYSTLIIGIVVVVVGCLAFYLFSGSSTPDITSVNPVGGSSGSQLLDLLNQSKSITLDLSIFSDPVFQSLVDSNQPIPPQPVGRSNPFLPLAASATTKTAVKTP